MESHKILKVNFSHFPTDGNTAQIPGKLFLLDNFDTPVKYEQSELMTYPVQLTMACLIFVKCGEVRIKLDMKEVTATTGMVISIIPGTFFQSIYRSDDAECAVIAAHRDIFTLGDIRLGVEFAKLSKQFPVRKLSYHGMEEIISIYRALKHKLFQEDYQFKEEVAKSYLNIMKCNAYDGYLKLKDSIKEDIPKPSSRKEEIFMQFINEVHMHFIEERNITFYADKLCVTPKYLSTVIHEVSNKYATDWITELVIIEAKSKLKDRTKTIKDVCNELNFSNQSFFAKYFKQHTGYTPKEFKNL